LLRSWRTNPQRGPVLLAKSDTPPAKTSSTNPGPGIAQ
jgi:hypothetical protein